MTDSNYRRLIEQRARQVRNEIDARLGRPAPLQQQPASPAWRGADRLQPGDWHAIAAADSALRHSIVQDCLYNAQTYAEYWPAKAQDETFRRQCGEVAQSINDAADRLKAHLRTSLLPGLQLADLAPEASRRMLDRVNTLHRDWERTLRGLLPPATAAATLKQEVTELLAELHDMKQRLDQQRSPVWQPVRACIAANEARWETQDIHVSASAQPEAEQARTFLDETVWQDLCSEIFRNAERHAFANRPAGTRGQVDVKARLVKNQSLVHLTFTDNGPGLQNNASTRGTGEGLDQNTARASLLAGLFRMRDTPHGACAEVLLPLRLPPDRNALTSQDWDCLR